MVTPSSGSHNNLSGIEHEKVPPTLPLSHPREKHNDDTEGIDADEQVIAATKGISASQAKQRLCPAARLRIHLDELSHPAIARFSQTVNLSTLLEKAILDVQRHLFTPQQDDAINTTTERPIKPVPDWEPQEVRSITLILRPMEGVAYTTGTTLDEAHKEIHLSLDYLSAKIEQFVRQHPSTTSTAAAAAPTTSRLPDVEMAVPSRTSTSPNSAFRHEVRGVVTHEMVHVFQHNGGGSCPGGLIEGIADYVRLKSNLDPPHWQPWPANEKTRGRKFDEGYQKTAWFLEWIEDHIAGKGCIGKLNEAMREHKWQGGLVWKDIMNDITVQECWELYKGDWEAMNKRHDEQC